jgi:hypothetical protein
MATGDLRKCPQCAELVKREAKICRFCHSALEPLQAESDATEAGGDNLSAAKNLAAGGHSAAEISKELQKWRGLTSTEADALAKSAVGAPLNRG